MTIRYCLKWLLIGIGAIYTLNFLESCEREPVPSHPGTFFALRAGGDIEVGK